MKNTLHSFPPQKNNYVNLNDINIIKNDSTLTNFGGMTILEKYVFNEKITEDNLLKVNLEWRVLRNIDKDYTFFVHLLDSNKKVVAQIDQYPVNGTFPTSIWKPNTIVNDNYLLEVPNNLPSGYYEIEIGIYLSSNMERVQILDQNQSPIADHLILGKIKIE